MKSSKKIHIKPDVIIYLVLKNTKDSAYTFTFFGEKL